MNEWNEWFELPARAVLLSTDEKETTRLRDYLFEMPANGALENILSQLAAYDPVVDWPGDKIVVTYERGPFRGLVVIQDELTGSSRVSLIESLRGDLTIRADARLPRTPKGELPVDTKRLEISTPVFLPQGLNATSKSVWGRAIEDALERGESQATLYHFVVAVFSDPSIVLPIEASNRSALIEDIRRLSDEQQSSQVLVASSLVEPRMLDVLWKLFEFTVIEINSASRTAAAILEELANQDAGVDSALSARGLSRHVLNALIQQEK